MKNTIKLWGKFWLRHLWQGGYSVGYAQIITTVMTIVGARFLFIFEVFISFLPFLVLMAWIDLVRIWFLRKQLHFSKDKLGQLLFNYRKSIFAIYFIITVALSWQVLSESFIKPPIGKQVNDQILRIVWFNKYFKNENYKQIRRRIVEINADIVGMAEVNVNQIEKLNLNEIYPYIVHNPFNRRYKATKDSMSSTVALFSKYPIIPQNNGQEANFFTTESSYLMNLRIMREDVKYEVFVVHMPTPVNQSGMIQRNNLFVQLQKQIQAQNTKHIIVLGDFNTTPWSPAMQDFRAHLPQLMSVATGQGLQSTFGYFPFIVHIDHIFVPSGSRVKRYVVDKKLDSDHNLIWTDVFMAY